MERRGLIAVLVVAPLAGVLVASLFSRQVPHVATEHSAPTPVASRSAKPSVAPTGTPREETAASVRINDTFDLLPTGGDVPEWQATDAATLNVAAAPTAVDRSALLTAAGTGSACRPVAEEFANLIADFMVEPLPAERLAALTIELTQDSRVALTVSAEGAQLADSSERIGLEPRTWYRWSVSRADDSYHVALSEIDGAELGRAEVEAPDAATERFCISTESLTRIYLDTLTVEGH